MKMHLLEASGPLVQSVLHAATSRLSRRAQLDAMRINHSVRLRFKIVLRAVGVLESMPLGMPTLVATMLDEHEDEDVMMRALQAMQMLAASALATHAPALVALLEHKHASVRDEVASGLLPTCCRR